MRTHKAIKGLLSVSMLLGLIEVTLLLSETPSFFFPKPSEIFLAIAPQFGGATIAWAITTSEALVGLTMAIVASSLLAGLTVFLPSRIVSLVNSIGTVIQSTPLLAVAPLLSLWFGQSFGAKSAAACIACFFPLLSGWLAGLRSVDPDQLQLFENLRVNNIQRIRHLLIPAALPYFFGGLRVAVPLSLLGAIIGEFIGSSEGIGFRILSSSYYIRTPLMFAYIIIAASTGWVLSALIAVLERKLLFWHGEQRQIK